MLNKFNHRQSRRNEEGSGTFWCHQLQESGRGLVTFDINTPDQRDLFITLDDRGSHTHSDILGASGPVYRHYRHWWVYWFVWGGWGGNKSRFQTILNRKLDVHENDVNTNGNRVPFPAMVLHGLLLMKMDFMSEKEHQKIFLK